MTDNKYVLIICTIILSFGIAVSGFFVSKAACILKKMSRTVTVKGLAERDVKSDLGIWEINYREVGNDLVALDAKLLQDQELVITFLKQQGFTDDEIYRSQLKVEDRLANTYSTNNDNTNNPRYVVTAGMRVRSMKVDLISKSVALTDKLLQQGIPLAFDVAGVSPNPSYYFMQLDAIRPQMMADATKSAYTIAAQFAKDSDSDLAGIQHATQGVFQIMGRDTSTMSSDWSSNENALGSIAKKVRLVTTIDYRLK